MSILPCVVVNRADCTTARGGRIFRALVRVQLVRALLDDRPDLLDVALDVVEALGLVDLLDASVELTAGRVRLLDQFLAGQPIAASSAPGRRQAHGSGQGREEDEDMQRPAHRDLPSDGFGTDGSRETRSYSRLPGYR